MTDNDYVGEKVPPTYDDLREMYKLSLLEQIADELDIDYATPAWRHDKL